MQPSLPNSMFGSQYVALNMSMWVHPSDGSKVTAKRLKWFREEGMFIPRNGFPCIFDYFCTFFRHLFDVDFLIDFLVDVLIDFLMILH